MTRIAVMGDSGAGTTSWLHAMCGEVPLNIYRSTGPEHFTYTCSPPVIFVGIPGHCTDLELVTACDGCDGAVVLYTQCNSRGLYWLRRLAHLFGPITIPTIVCAHKSDLHATSVPAWLHQFPTVEHTNTRLERRVGIVDCANRIIMRARRTLASPLAVHSE